MSKKVSVVINKAVTIKAKQIGPQATASGLVNPVNHIQLDLTPTAVPTSIGTISWDAEHDTPKVQLRAGGVDGQMFLDDLIYVYNSTGSIIPDGAAVYINGVNDHVNSVALAIANDSVKSVPTGIATEAIAIGEYGWITQRGQVHGFDTSGFVPGDILYLSDTVAGGLQKTKPLPPNYVFALARCQNSAVDGTIYVDKSIDTTDIELVDAAVVSKDPTGWLNNAGITSTYDPITRKINLTGDLRYAWRGYIIDLGASWESDAHPAGTGVAYYLYSTDGINFVWSTSVWEFSDMIVAFVWHGASNKYGVVEVHGLMNWQSHQEFHQTQGTYRVAGGTLSSYVLASTVAVDRRPDVSSTSIKDEDIITALPALTSKLFTRAFLTGAGVMNFETDQTEIVPLSGSQPYWNQFTGGVWQQTLVANNSYVNIWLVAVPVTSDAGSQKYRYLWLQGQSSSVSLATQQAKFPSDLSLGDFTPRFTEFVFIAKVILRYQGGNWHIAEVTNLTGTRQSVTGSPAGVFLSVVEHDSTLTGSGTLADPLSVPANSHMVEPRQSLTESATDIDWLLGNVILTANDNVVISTFSNVSASSIHSLTMKLKHVGGVRTLTLPASVINRADLTLVGTSGGYDIIEFVALENATDLYVYHVGGA